MGSDREGDRIKFLIDKLRGTTRRQRDDVHNRRNDFVSFQVEDSATKKSGLFGRLVNQFKPRRMFVCALLLVAAGAGGLAYWQPDLVAHLKNQDIAATYQTYLADWRAIWQKVRLADEPRRMEAEPESALPAKDFVFTQDQVERAKAELLQQRQANKQPDAAKAGDATSEQTAPVTHQYEIALSSGGRIYATNVIITDDRVTYEDEKGMLVTIKQDEVMRIRRLRIGQ